MIRRLLCRFGINGIFAYWDSRATDGMFGIFGQYIPRLRTLKFRIAWYFGALNWYVEFGKIKNECRKTGD